jgi:hypothetical protein
MIIPIKFGSITPYDHQTTGFWTLEDMLLNDSNDEEVLYAKLLDQHE